MPTSNMGSLVSFLPSFTNVGFLQSMHCSMMMCLLRYWCIQRFIKNWMSGFKVSNSIVKSAVIKLFDDSTISRWIRIKLRCSWYTKYCRFLHVHLVVPNFP
jgi:hypothetical protein